MINLLMELFLAGTMITLLSYGFDHRPYALAAGLLSAAVVVGFVFGLLLPSLCSSPSMSLKVADIVKPNPISDSLAFKFTTKADDVVSMTYRGHVVQTNFDAFLIQNSIFKHAKDLNTDESLLVVEDSKEFLRSDSSADETSSSAVLSQSGIGDKKASLVEAVPSNLVGNVKSGISQLPEVLIPDRKNPTESIIPASQVQAEELQHRNHGINKNIKLVLTVSEDVMCLYRGGIFEKSELRGIFGAQLQSSAFSASQPPSSSSPASLHDLSISIHDKQKVLCRYAANKQHISDLIESDAVEENRSIAAHSLPIDSEKVVPLLKYAALPSFEPSLLRARSKVKVVMPNAKVYVQVSLNPVYRSQMDSVLVQASVSVFTNIGSVKFTPSSIAKNETFDSGSKVISWLCPSMSTSDSAGVLQLEAIMEDIVCSDNMPAVPVIPLIVKVLQPSALVSDTDFDAMVTTVTSASGAKHDHVSAAVSSSSSLVIDSEDEQVISRAVNKKSKVEYRFF